MKDGKERSEKLGLVCTESRFESGDKAHRKSHAIAVERRRLLFCLSITIIGSRGKSAFGVRCSHNLWAVIVGGYCILCERACFDA